MKDTERRRLAGPLLAVGVCGMLVFGGPVPNVVAGPGPCVCDADVAGGIDGCTPDGLIDFADLLVIVRCVDLWFDECGVGVIETCDVNCDGVVSFSDFGQALCEFQGMDATQCCELPVGACCPDGRECQLLTQATCDGLSQWFGLSAVYHGDGSTCDPSPCDCNGNGIPDDQDIAGGTSEDCNGNNQPDECEIGGCCFEQAGVQACANSTGAECDAVGGTSYGPCDLCPEQNAALITEPGGGVFIHVVGPPMECPLGGRREPAPLRGCEPNLFKDVWESPANGAMCHNFSGDPIPADFFGPGSDPFAGSICLQGVPLGDPLFPGADTLIRRTEDPFERCGATALPETAPPVSIEIVALSLANDPASPHTVTYNGGQNPEAWDVAVDLSPVNTPPPGTLTATKTYCNGGTYVSDLNVWPRFTFTRRSDATEAELTATNFLTLSQTNPAPWVHDVAPGHGATFDPCSDFHPGFADYYQRPDCDCNNNALRDLCDIENGTSGDCNANGTPDECDIADGTSQDSDGNGVPDECLVAPPGPPLPEQWNNPSRTVCAGPGDAVCLGESDCVPAPNGTFPGTCYAPKNRWLSVAPNPANAGVDTARRITLTSGDACAPQVMGWLGAPDARGVVRIVPEASRHYMDWTTVAVPEWCSDDAHCLSGTCDIVAGQCNTSTTNVVQVGDCETSPSMAYDIEVIAAGSPITDPAGYSAALSLWTVPAWGDVIGATVGGGLFNLPADGGATFGDILGVVKGFQGVGASPTSWLDLVAASAVDPIPDYEVGFGDILAAVQGFGPGIYTLPLPCSCP